MLTKVIYINIITITLTIVDATFYGYGLDPYHKDVTNSNQQNKEIELKQYLPDFNENIQIKQIKEWTKSKSAEEVQNWPVLETLQNLGEVSGVATSRDNHIHVFHRADEVWDQSSFDENNIYNYKNRAPIANDTILVLEPTDGRIIKSWGNDRFYLPHGISIDPQGNVWLTDVALHQVFRFKRGLYTEPDLILGERFVPGNDGKHFCKPTDIAISSSGIVYISDGYCNSRILIFSPEGHYIGQFGLTDNLKIPHSLTLLELEDLLCVADRENRRILCYTAGLSGEHQAGKLVFNIQHSQLGPVYAIDHIGDIILAINGREGNVSPPKGLSLDLATEQLVDVWEPTTGKFEEPHDIAVSSDGTSFYVSQISMNSYKKLYKFIIV